MSGGMKYGEKGDIVLPRDAFYSFSAVIRNRMRPRALTAESRNKEK